MRAAPIVVFGLFLLFTSFLVGQQRLVSPIVAGNASWPVRNDGKPDAAVFAELSTRCTDKTSTHQYQHVYANALSRFRELPPAGHRPYRLLEIGLGCTMVNCVAGGMKLFRSYLPHVQYFGFEYDYELCRNRFRQSGLSDEEIAYIDSHHCTGDSGNVSDLIECSKRFGPFDIIVDDGSHFVAHVMTAFRFLYPSSFLNYGGVYVVEDLQTHTSASYRKGFGGKVTDATMGTLVADLVQWKMDANPHSGKRKGRFAKDYRSVKATDRTVVAETPMLGMLTKMVVCGPEICAFHKVDHRPPSLGSEASSPDSLE